MIVLIAVGVFAAACALDFAIARYYRAVSEKQAHAAACWSLTIRLLSLVGLAAVLTTPWLVLVECAGLYTGTYLAVKR